MSATPPSWAHGNVRLYLGDSVPIMAQLDGVDAVISDPPYGIGLATDYAKRFKPGVGKWWKSADRSGAPRHKSIIGDDEPFDPAPLLAMKSRAKVLWGANCYANRLPDSGGWWVWDKRGGRRDVSEAAWPMGEGEIAWTNIGKGVRIFRHTWFGLIRDSERGEHYHPTQKPVALMAWCIEKAKVPIGALVADPYMGSGSTAVAAIRTGRGFVGIEQDPEHYATALARVQQELAQGDFLRPATFDTEKQSA